jgi:uncharacterized membrane protein
MRALLEKKKKLPLWLLVVFVIIASVFALFILSFVFSLVNKEENKQVQNNPVPVKEVELVQPKEEKQEEEKQELINSFKSDYEILQEEYFKLEKEKNNLTNLVNNLEKEKQDLINELTICQNEPKKIIFESDRKEFLYYL